MTTDHGGTTCGYYKMRSQRVFTYGRTGVEVVVVIVTSLVGVCQSNYGTLKETLYMTHYHHVHREYDLTIGLSP